MANNPLLYNAVIAGATGGYAKRGATTDVTALLSLANSVDTQIPTDPDINWQHVYTLQGICYGIFAKRSYTNLDVLTKNMIVNNIVTLFEVLKPTLQEPPGVPDGEFDAATILPG